ncbi:Acylphosphatase [Anaerohalosphaera lusitana]|uniref:acylphosphatase n=1 Tax=Anaerohalosphaera lusitana TaxID=1936003 RepID=A0A1U9NIJ3_9BACT|nr:acylphosphatase [Anaerohalosphaera lusitana]AQT67410.1 Acylphosphatase [Anaerohalosphaera lusitana]
MADTAKKIIYKGRVQGVGFRYTASRIADRYELKGYVKNLPDGSVEIFAQGHPDDIQDFIADLQETFAAHIRDREMHKQEPSGRYQGFGIAF